MLPDRSSIGPKGNDVPDSNMIAPLKCQDPERLRRPAF